MPVNPTFSDEYLLAILDEHRHYDGKPNSTALAAVIGVSRSTIQSRLAKLSIQGRMLNEGPAMPGFEITKVTSRQEDGSTVTQKPIRPTEVTLPAGHILERATLKRGDDWLKTKLSPNYHNREELLEAFEEYRGRADLVPLSSAILDKDLATVYTMSDLHIGMLSWGRETGCSWDLQIARDTILGTMTELVQCSPPASLAILLDLGDYTHNNNQTNVTPGHSNQLDVDGRFRKIGKEAMRLRLELIELLLQKHARVIVRSLPGNHDPDVTPIISAAFSLFFEKNTRVEIDDDPSELWAFEFGINMLCGNHGHKIKPSRLPGVMAARWPEMWGRTKVRQAWSGHIHHETSGDENGARWKTLRTPAPSDSYGHSHGFTAGRELKSSTYHRTRGWRGDQVVQIL